MPQQRKEDGSDCKDYDKKRYPLGYTVLNLPIEKQRRIIMTLIGVDVMPADHPVEATASAPKKEVLYGWVVGNVKYAGCWEGQIGRGVGQVDSEAAIVVVELKIAFVTSINFCATTN